MSKILRILYALFFIIFAICMMSLPQATFEGATNGLFTWATILVPSLLPFFIIAEILLNLGVVRFLGVLLEPIMRPLFNLPGAASFVLAMGFTSGFPMGAVLSVRLREKNLCTKSEAARLVAFTNNSSPLFILVAIAIGMFGHPIYGFVLAAVHYLSNLTLGVFLGFSSKRSKPFEKKVLVNTKSNILIESFKALIDDQKKNNLQPGKLLGDAIKKGISTITTIGGFVISFAVLINILEALGFISYCNQLLANFFKVFTLNSYLSKGLITGFFEMTLGAKAISQASATFIEQIVAISVILAWSGLSIQFQVLSILSTSDISTKYYLIGRVFQGIIAIFYIFLLSGPINNFFNLYSVPVSTIFYIYPNSSFNLGVKIFYLTGIFSFTALTILVFIGLSIGLINTFFNNR